MNYMLYVAVNVSDTKSRAQLCYARLFVSCAQSVAILALLLFAITPQAQASTIVDYNINTNTTWTIDHSPYLIQRLSNNSYYLPLIINQGVTLTIEPGVVVKFIGYNGMRILGTLRSIGTENQPIFFTSFADDTVGGDSDNVTTTPDDAQWVNLQFENGSTGDLDHTVIMYGGQAISGGTSAGIINKGGIVTIDHSHVSHNAGNGLVHLEGTTHIRNSEFDHHAIGIIQDYSGGTLYVDTTNIHDNDIGIRKKYIGTLSVHNSRIYDNGVGIDNQINTATSSANEIEFYPHISTDATGTWTDTSMPHFIVSGLRIWHGIYPDRSHIVRNGSGGVGCNMNAYSDALFSGNHIYGSMRVGGCNYYPQYVDGPYWVEITDGGGAYSPHWGYGNQERYFSIVRSGGVWFDAKSAADNGFVATTTVDATSNWWGSATGPTHTSNPTGTGDIVSDNVTFTPFLTTDPFAPRCTINCNSSVLFLPGIESSRLYRPQVVGSEDKRLWEPNSDVDAMQLALNTDGTSVHSDVYTKDIIDEAYATQIGPNIYKSFIAMMNTLKSTNKINDWQSAPYDWRLSLDQILSSGTQTGQNISYLTATSTPYIEQELRRLAAASRTGKVTIIAHSNGGLVAKALMQKLGATTTAELIDKVIMVAVPQVGTPTAVAGLLHGYDQGIPFKVSDNAMRYLGNNAPTIYNLLPSNNYFTYIDDPVVTFDTATLPDWVLRYGNTIHSQERLHTFLTSTYARVATDSTDTISPVQLNDTLLTQAEGMHTSLDAWAPPQGVQLIQIAGWGIPTTLKGVEYASTSRPIFCLTPCTGGGLGITASTTIDGDGTVVVPSALWMSTTTGAVNYWVDLKEYNKDHPLQSVFPATRFNHARIFETEAILSFISDQISSTTKPLSDYVYISTEAPRSTENRLRYALHSPLTLNLYDDQGRHTGVSTTTGQTEEQIPGTYYMQFGNVKYIFSDASTTAHIVMDGYAQGTFTFNVDQYIGDTRTASTTFQDIPTTASTTVNMNVQSDITTLSSMQIDKNGDGIVDATLAPKLNDTVTLDTTPPEIQITFATSTRALVFIGIDDMGTTTITATTTYPTLKKKQKEYQGIATTTVTVRDAIGNTASIVYTEKLPYPSQRDTITLQALAYNGATTTLTNTSLSYKWRLNKNNTYKLFASYIKTIATTTESHYRPKKNQTIIMTKPQEIDGADDDDDTDKRATKLKLPGMIVPSLTTNTGRFIISY